MPRVHFVKKARKDNPAVKAGESYYWWKHAFGPKRYSKTRPRTSQLKQGKNAAFYAALEAAEDEINRLETIEDLESCKDTLLDELESVQEEYQDGLDAMPEQLQWGSTGESIQEAIDAIEELRNEIDYVDIVEFDRSEWDEEEPDPDDFDDPDEYNDALADWNTEKADHESEQDAEEQQHLESTKEELASAMGCHNFPF
jgi:hypothetical protein